MDISEIFEDLLQKSELHLGANSITRLWAFLRGYMAALEAAKVHYNDQDFAKFCKWIENKYDLRTTHSWAEIILFMSFSDENKAIINTQKLWDEYKNKIQK